MINERDKLASGGAMALGRKVDDQITTVLDTTSQTAVTITVTSSGAIRAGALGFTEALWANDVPNDGMVYSVVTPRLWSQFMLLQEFSRTELVRPARPAGRRVGKAWV